MTDKLKIVMLTPYFYPHTGGTEKYVRDLAEGLIAAGHEVTVISNNVPKEKNAPAEENMKGIKVKRLPAIDMFYAPTSLAFNLDMVKGYDIIHTHAPAFGFTRVVAGNVDTPVVTTYHCDITLSDRAFGVKLPKWLINLVEGVGNAMARAALKKVDIVYNTTESYAKTSPVLKNMPRRSIPIGIHYHNLDNLMKEFNIDSTVKNKGQILFLSRLAANKGLHVLVDAMPKVFKEMPEAKLIICGEGEEKKSIVAQVERMGLKDKVEFYGIVEKEKFISLYSKSNVFVLPSTNRLEAFGIVQIEAMTCKTPVVCSNLPGVNSVAKGAGLIARIGDHEDLADKILQVLKNPEKARQMGEEGRRLVETEYSWPRIVDRVVGLYREAIEKKKLSIAQ